jgi:hypothetical protein
MSTPPTPEQLRAAWKAMRSRPGLKHWPTEFDQVMGDLRRAKCIAIEATAAARRAQRLTTAADVVQTLITNRPHPARAHHPTPTRTTTNTTDLKRAAAGDLDD